MNNQAQVQSNEQVMLAKLQARIAELEAAAAQAASQPLKIHIGPKGTVCVTGIGSKYGVALYQESWGKLLGFAPQIAEFIKANEGKLAKKGVEYVAPAASAKVSV